MLSISHKFYRDFGCSLHQKYTLSAHLIDQLFSHRTWAVDLSITIEKVHTINQKIRILSHRIEDVDQKA
jgi:hypothetical protein